MEGGYTKYKESAPSMIDSDGVVSPKGTSSNVEKKNHMHFFANSKEEDYQRYFVSRTGTNADT
jgi:hypothetical protein